MVKKLVISSITLVLMTTLIACSNNETATNKHLTTTVQSSSSSSKDDNRQYDDVVSQIKTTFKNYNVSVKIKNNVVSNGSQGSHDEINVFPDDKFKNDLTESWDALYSRTATDEQKQKIQAIRQSVSDIAKKLPNNSTHISFKIKIAKDEYNLLAESTKDEDIVPINYNSDD
jgi:hypothetical protein